MSGKPRGPVDNEFIAAVTDYCRAKVDEWYANNEKPGDRADLALQEVVRTRVTVRAALARVQLTARQQVRTGRPSAPYSA